jgi:hypothetical protein
MTNKLFDKGAIRNKLETDFSKLNEKLNVTTRFRFSGIQSRRNQGIVSSTDENFQLSVNLTLNGVKSFDGSYGIRFSIDNLIEIIRLVERIGNDFSYEVKLIEFNQNGIFSFNLYNR